MKALIDRLQENEKETLGRFFLISDKMELLFTCTTLEPAWKDNKTGISCIPAGVYVLEHRCSEKYEHHLILVGTDKREYILIHWGNFYFDTRGCVIVGLKHRDINADGYLDVVDSKKAFDKLMDLVKNEKQIRLRICYN